MVIKINSGEPFFAKSMEFSPNKKTLQTYTIKNRKKIPNQTVDDMIETGLIHCNTLSFGLPRLCCTQLDKDYKKTYRPNGIIFQEKYPGYSCILPFDLSLLSTAKEIIRSPYKDEKIMAEYYKNKLIVGYTKFLFNDMEEMKKKFPTSKDAWIAVYNFRIISGYVALPDELKAMTEYNEAIFLNVVKFENLTIFGPSKVSQNAAAKYKLPYFKSAKEFYEKIVEKK